jgi:amino acid transporter
VVWQIIGTIIIVTWTLVKAPQLQQPSFVFFGYNNDTGFSSMGYVALVGTLAAASVFTGYDTAAHVSEETSESHTATPYAMLYSVYNAIVLGLLLIVGMNFCIQDLDEITVRIESSLNHHVHGFSD